MIRAVAILVTLAGCGAAAPIALTETQLSENGTMALELHDCTTLAGSRAADDACQDGVRDRWCAPGQPLAGVAGCLPEGGVLFVDAGAVVILDGGGQ
jgi:hypothetical protein